jgi:hypothetical protein
LKLDLPFSLIAHNRTGSFLSAINLYIISIVCGIFLVIFDAMDGINYMGDIDDVLRRLQVNTLMETGNWFDRTLPMIQMPEAYISPWSRLVDLPYVLIAWLFSPFFEMPSALNLAFFTWPPLMLAAYCILVVKIQKLILPDGVRLDPFYLILTLLLMTLPIWEFTPKRIDHHNVQLLLSLLLFFGLLKWSRTGGLIAGFAVVLSVAVGLELLPMLAFILVAVCACWVLNRRGSAAFLQSFGFSITIFTPLAGLFLIGPYAMAQTACDAFSAPYLSGLFGYGLLSASLPVLFEKQSAVKRFYFLGLAGLLLITVLALAFPLCLSGPYHMIDPLSRALWLGTVVQEQSFFVFFKEGNIVQLVNLALVTVIAIAASPILIRQWHDGLTGAIIVFGAGILCLALTCLQIRYIRFPFAFIPLFVPYLFYNLRLNPKAAGWLTAAGITSITTLGLGLHLAIPVKILEPDAIDYMLFWDCKNPELSALEALPPGRIMAPSSLGLFMASRLPAGMSVAAVSFHRASPAIRRTLETFIVADAAARKAALEPFDYLAVCRIELPQRISNSTLFATLTRGNQWPGLEPIETAKASQIRLFRINHARLK